MVVSSSMIAQPPENSWSELLTPSAAGRTARLRPSKHIAVFLTQSEQSCSESPAATRHHYPHQTARWAAI
jgi:hypothetical protein